MVEQIYLALHEERHKDLRKEVEREQLLRAIKGENGRSIRKAVGRVLITAGRILAEPNTDR